MQRKSLEYFRGCLLGGAVGDALGAPVEFMHLAEIRSRFGQAGIHSIATDETRHAHITDDTQMTLFTAEGLIRAHIEKCHLGQTDIVRQTHWAYLRWLDTQGVSSAHPDYRQVQDGWLREMPALRHQRGPGATCLSALKGATIGTIEAPLNDSKGCGGIMRSAPVGLVCDNAFEIGCRLAAITHSHPSGYLPAGFLAETIALIIQGADVRSAVSAALDVLVSWEGHEETLAAVNKALEMTEYAFPTPESVEEIGEGWVGEEALAIALFCALVSADFASAVILAANHGGDSDSTAAITGNIMGALYGEDAIPGEWLEVLDVQEEIEELTDDLFHYFHDRPAALSEEARLRYPPY